MKQLLTLTVVLITLFCALIAVMPHQSASHAHMDEHCIGHCVSSSGKTQADIRNFLMPPALLMTVASVVLLSLASQLSVAKAYLARILRPPDLYKLNHSYLI